MRRRILVFFACVSLLLLLAVLGLGLESVRKPRVVLLETMQWPAGGLTRGQYTLALERGSLWIEVVRSHELLDARERFWSASSDWIKPRLVWSAQWEDRYPLVFTVDRSAKCPCGSGETSIWGCAFYFHTDADEYGSLSEVHLMAPLWLVGSPLGVLPLVWLLKECRDLRRRRRVARGLCADCGYDLRATPRRCPECGRIVDGAPAPWLPYRQQWHTAIMAAGGLAVILAGVISWGRFVVGRQTATWEQARHIADRSRRLLNASALGAVCIPNINEYLDEGADINVQDDQDGSAGTTPLMNAVRSPGHIRLVRLLLDRGADVRLADDQGHTPLHIAAGEGRVDLVELLLERGALVNARRLDGATPLHWGLIGKHEDAGATARVLILHGADVKAVETNGNTPLHIAALFDHAELIAELIEHGADPSVRNAEGQTPLDMARGHSPRAAELLERAMNPP